MRRLMTLLLVVVTALAMMVPPALAAEPKLQVDGKPVGIEKASLVTDHGLMLPADAVAAALGGTFTWEKATGKGVLAVAQKRIELSLNQAEATVNGRSMTMPAPVQEKDGQVYLPATFLIMQFPGRLQVEHAAMKDAKALEILSRAHKNNPANQDIQMKMQVTVDEPGYFWVTLHGEAKGQIRGKDMLTTVKLNGPMMIREQMGTATKDGQPYMQFGDFWMALPTYEDEEFGAFESHLFDQMIAKPELQYDMLTKAAAEVRLGQQHHTSQTSLQEVQVTLDFGALLASLSPALGMERDPAGNPLPVMDPEMPEFTTERATVTYLVDLKTGQFVEQQIDMVVWIIVPTESSLLGTPLPKGSDIGIRLTVQGKSLHTPNNAPILWPEGMK